MNHILIDFILFFIEALIQRKILVLDLDETLIHSDFDTAAHNSIVRPNVPADFIVRVEVQKHPVKFYVYKRPHVDYFLEIVGLMIIM